MRVLVTWGSKRGGTEGLARMLGDALRNEGHEVDLRPCNEARDTKGYDAALIGGALYANRWHKDACRFVNRNEGLLRSVPVWFFSSGPLDDSAERGTLPPTRQVRVLMDRVGAQGHATFGGRLTHDARGFPASAMAKKLSGDWRKPELVRAWAHEIATALPSASPKPAVPLPGRSPSRLVFHGFAGWASCALLMAVLLATIPFRVAVVVHAIAVPILYTAVARHYFRELGARDPLPAAFSFIAVAAVLDVIVVGGLVHNGLAAFTSIAGTWVPFLLIFLTTWIVGAVMSTMPWPKPPDRRAPGKGPPSLAHAS